MTSPAWKEKSGITPGKLALVALLAAIFGVTLWLQFASEGAEAAVAPQLNRRRGAPQAAAPTAEKPNAILAKSAAKREWPVVPLEEALQHDPFASLALPAPAALALKPSPSGEVQQPEEPEPAALTASQREALERVRSLRMNAMILGPKGPVATIGTDLVRVGDVIEGFRVTKIDFTGITLADEKSSAMDE